MKIMYILFKITLLTIMLLMASIPDGSMEWKAGANEIWQPAQDLLRAGVTGGGSAKREEGFPRLLQSSTGGMSFPVVLNEATGAADSFPAPVAEEKEGQDYFLTYQEIKGLEKAGLVDQVMAAALFARIPKADLKRIQQLADGGITRKEEPEVRVLLEKSLRESDIRTLENILKRSRKSQNTEGE